MKRMLFTMLFLWACFPFSLLAQDDCQWLPAPCPHSSEISDAQDFVSRSADNKVLPQELAMEGKVRNFFTDLLHGITRQHHWILYELNESAFDRPNTFISYPKWEATSYEKRPPHAYYVSFIIIVNKDSLDILRNWLQTDYVQMADQVQSGLNASMQSQADDPRLKAYMDSSQYYTQLSVQYMQAHQQQYLRDIKSNNQKGIDAYTNKVDWFTARSDAFVKKYQDAADAASSGAGNGLDRLNKLKLEKMRVFMDASVILVSFSINTEQAGFGVIDNEQRSLLPQKKLSIPGAFYAGLLHNPQPQDDHAYDIRVADYVFPAPTNVATVLLGGWLPRYNSYNYMQAAYTANPSANNLVSIKSIKCDSVQNISMQVEGRPDHIMQILKSVDFGEMGKLIVRQTK